MCEITDDMHREELITMINHFSKLHGEAADESRRLRDRNHRLVMELRSLRGEVELLKKRSEFNLSNLSVDLRLVLIDGKFKHIEIDPVREIEFLEDEE